MPTIGDARRRWLETRHILVGQATLLLAEAGIMVLLLKWFILGGSLLIIIHLWAWRQARWRLRDINRLVRTVRQIGKT